VATITAGLLNYPGLAGGTQSINQMAGISAGPTINGVPQAATGWTFSPEQITGVLTRGVVNAGVSSAIQHTQFKDGFIASVVGDAATFTARDIGGTWGNGQNPAMHAISHTALGAGSAWLTGKDPMAGAIGGLTESVIDNTIGQALRDNKIELGKWGDLLYTTGSMAAAGLVAHNTGHDGATAASAAQNAAVNNRQFTDREKKRFQDIYGNDPERRKRAEAAMCALVKCYEDSDIEPGSQEYRDKLALAEWGKTLPEYTNVPFDLTDDGLFEYFPLKTPLSIVVDSSAPVGHVGVYLNGGDKKYLYDPNGSFEIPQLVGNDIEYLKRVTEDYLESEYDILPYYVKYQLKTTGWPSDAVTVFQYKISGTDAAVIQQNMIVANDECRGYLYCASCSSIVLDSKPFDYMWSTRFPDLFGRKLYVNAILQRVLRNDSMGFKPISGENYLKINPATPEIFKSK
jgi:hypothetical protein